MRVSYEEGAKIAEESGGGTYISLKDGEKTVIALVTEDVGLEFTYFNETTNKTEPFTDAHKAKGFQPKPRYKIPVFQRKDSKMKAFQCSAATFKDIIKCKGKYGASNKWFEIERKGTKKDTKYTILPDDDLTAADKALIASATPINIDELGDEEDESTDMNSLGKDKAAAGDKMAELIDADTFNQLLARLKPLKRPRADEWLKVMGVAKVKELTVGKLPAANKKLDELEAAEVAERAAMEAAKNGVAAKPAEVDPFE